MELMEHDGQNSYHRRGGSIIGALSAKHRRETIAAVIGGAVGGILCDNECRSTPDMRDALYGRYIAAGLSAFLLAIDWLFDTGIWIGILSQDRFSLGLGANVLLLTCAKGRQSDHRTFTPSLLYVMLIGFGFLCITPLLAAPVLAGGFSHLVIDTFNKKPVPWLHPIRKKGICFKVCYASKKGNTILMWAGLAASVALLAWRVSVAAGLM